MAPKRLLEKPPSAYSSSEEVETDPEQDVEEESGNRNGVAEGAHDEEERSGDDEDEDEDEDEEEDEEEKVKSPVKKPTVSKPNAFESCSDTESDGTPPSPSLSGFTVKPIASKTMDEDDSNVKPKARTPVPRPDKRASEGAVPPESEPSEKDSKSRKKRKVATNGGSGGGGAGEEEESKKPSSSGGARLWSEEDEIAVLKGMIDYKTKKGSDPNSDMVAFHEFIRKSLNADVSKNQLAEKIRRLKKKYLNNAAKGENDEDPVFSKPHELRSFELSKKIWGIGANKNPNGNAVEENGAKSNNSKKKLTLAPSTPRSKSTTTTVLALPNKKMSVKKEKKTREKVQANGKLKVEKEEEEEVMEEKEEEQEEEEDFWAKYPYLKNSLKLVNFNLGFEYLVDNMKEVMPLIESSKAKKLEKKWKELKAEEMELYVRMAGLFHEQAKLVFDSMKPE